MLFVCLTASTTSRVATASDGNGSVETRLGTTTVTLTSSTDTDLTVRVRAIRLTPSGGNTSTDLQVVVSIGAVETHQWAIPIDDGDFVDDESTGNASITAPSSELGPYGQISLTATPLGAQTTRVCSDGSAMDLRYESVAGSIDFSTGGSTASPWGRVSDHHVAFQGNSRLVQEFGTADDACFGPSAPGLTTCTPSIQWSSPYGSTGTISGGWQSSPHGRTGVITATNTVEVTQSGAPTAMRTDTDARHVAIPTAEVWPGRATVGVSGSPSQGVSGTASITSVLAPNVYPDDCNNSPTQVTTRAYDSSVRPGSSPLTIGQAIGGPIVLGKRSLGAAIRYVTRAGQSSIG